MPNVERCTVVLDGVVTSDATREVADALGCLRPGGALRVDLRKAQEVPAVALAQLAGLLQPHRRSLTIQLVGLRWRDCRILSYLGFDLDASGRAVGPGQATPDDQPDAA